MKLSRQKLKRIIKEEKRKLLQEQEDPYMQEELKIGIEKFAGLWSERSEEVV